MEILGAVEGLLDRTAFDVLVKFSGHEPGSVRGLRGKDVLDKEIQIYNSAARFRPWLVLRDFDVIDGDCPRTFRTRLIPVQAPMLHFRLAIREIEAWIWAMCLGWLNFSKLRQHISQPIQSWKGFPKRDYLPPSNIQLQLD